MYRYKYINIFKIYSNKIFWKMIGRELTVKLVKKRIKYFFILNILSGDDLDMKTVKSLGDAVM